MPRCRPAGSGVLQPALSAAASNTLLNLGEGQRQCELIGRQHAHLIAKHDIKLEMDVRAQEFIYRRISRAFPHHAFLGEEDTAYHGGRCSATAEPEFRWVIDPLDGTVNYRPDGW